MQDGQISALKACSNSRQRQMANVQILLVTIRTPACDSGSNVLVIDIEMVADWDSGPVCAGMDSGLDTIGHGVSMWVWIAACNDVYNGL